ncbi:MAG TPA: extracellular solute-binding protein [Xanthobacteraceae bacterium]|nr:extracellular solute-binding protein [Xanthobacteraceae bacterium]
MKKIGSTIIGFAAGILVASSAVAQTADWKKTWDETLAAAKKEGKVAVVGSPDPVMRNEVIPAFEKRYPGIKVDYLAGRSAEIVERVKLERASGIYAVDAYLSGPDTQYNILHAEKLIDPLRPYLVLPEVTEGKNWKPGKLWFMDKDGAYVLRLFNSVDSLLFINTDLVKPEEMKSAKDLLNPKWQGKISSEDPTSDRGSGGNTAANIYSQLGGDFAKKLYVGQKVQFSRDRRQLTDWLARGNNPICLTCRADDVRPLQKEGFKITEIYDLEGLTGRVNSSPFLLSVANKPAHPNAMKVFVNWLAGKEGLEIYSRGFQAVTLRTDVDESFLDPRSIPMPGVSYPDDADPKWRSVDKLEYGAKIRAMLKN